MILACLLTYLLSHSLRGRRGTNEVEETSCLHESFSVAALRSCSSLILIHSLFGPPHSLLPGTLPCSTVFAKLESLVTWPNHLIFLPLTMLRCSSYGPTAQMILDRTLLFVIQSLQLIPYSFLKHCISISWILFSRSLLRVHDSQAQRKAEMTRALFNLMFDLTFKGEHDSNPGCDVFYT